MDWMKLFSLLGCHRGPSHLRIHIWWPDADTIMALCNKAASRINTPQCHSHAGGYRVNTLQCHSHVGGYRVNTLQCHSHAGGYRVNILQCHSHAGGYRVNILQCHSHAGGYRVNINTLQCHSHAGGYKAGVGGTCTKALFINFSLREISDLAKIVIRVFKSHSNLTGVTAFYLSNMNAIFKR